MSAWQCCCQYKADALFLVLLSRPFTALHTAAGLISDCLTSGVCACCLHGMSTHRAVSREQVPSRVNPYAYSTTAGLYPSNLSRGAYTLRHAKGELHVSAMRLTSVCAPTRGGSLRLLRFESSLLCSCLCLDIVHCESISHLIVSLLCTCLEGAPKSASGRRQDRRPAPDTLLEQ